MELLDLESLYTLENISTQNMTNRIIKDINLLSEFSSSISIHIDEEKGLPVITVHDLKYNIYNVYSFVINSSYPFTPPPVFINSISYNKFCKINTIGFSKNLKKIVNIYCFCCNSILNNWSPVNNFGDIIREIRYFKKLRTDVINKIFADVIIRKYLINEIDLYCWLY
jgi:hypothetical protein